MQYNSISISSFTRLLSVLSAAALLGLAGCDSGAGSGDTTLGSVEVNTTSDTIGFELPRRLSDARAVDPNFLFAEVELSYRTITRTATAFRASNTDRWISDLVVPSNTPFQLTITWYDTSVSQSRLNLATLTQQFKAIEQNSVIELSFDFNDFDDSVFDDDSDGSSNLVEVESGTNPVDSNSITPQQDGYVITLVLPSDAPQSTCVAVPVGYEPIEGATIQFVDANGAAIPGEVIITDDCGTAAADTLPTGAVAIVATSDGNRDIIATITEVSEAGSVVETVASTIPETSMYDIGFLQIFDDGTVGFTVTDSTTDKAVIGLPSTSFTLAYDGTSTGFSSLGSAVTSSDAASITLVMDASGSMNSSVTIDNGAATLTRREIAASAAHQFLDEKNPSDTASILVFDSRSRVDFLDDATLNSVLDIVDQDGNAASYNFSADGFSTSSADLRFLVDAYNENSDLWLRGSSEQPRHPAVPSNLFLSGSDRWGGSTAFFDASITAIDKLDPRQSPRKFVIAMTDGNDTSSREDKEDVIAAANAAQTAVYTIGFEFTADEDDLREIAEQTGANYFQANSLDLAGAFQSIQTNIIFQYTGVPQTDLPLNTPITLSFDIDGDGIVDAERTVVRQ